MTDEHLDLTEGFVDGCRIAAIGFIAPVIVVAVLAWAAFKPSEPDVCEGYTAQECAAAIEARHD